MSSLDSPLHVWFDQISTSMSLNASWLTFLSVCSDDFTIKDLISISDLHNLALLSLVGTKSSSTTTLDDRMIWKWARYLSDLGEPTHLTHLHTIEFVAQESISFATVEYLSQFPALAQIMSFDCRNLTMDFRLGNIGWRYYCQSGEQDGGSNNDSGIQHVLRPRRPLEYQKSERKHHLMKSYAQACQLVDDGRPSKNTVPPVLSLTLGLINKFYSRGSNRTRLTLHRCLENPAKAPRNVDRIEKAQEGGLKHPQGELRSPVRKKRRLKAAKHSDLSNVMKGFMF